MKEAANIMAIIKHKSTGIENVKSNTTNILVAMIDENDKFNARNMVWKVTRLSKWQEYKGAKMKKKNYIHIDIKETTVLKKWHVRVLAMVKGTN